MCFTSAIKQQFNHNNLISSIGDTKQRKKKNKQTKKEGRLGDEEIFTVVPFFKNETRVMGGGFFRFTEIWGGVVTLVGYVVRFL